MNLRQYFMAYYNFCKCICNLTSHVQRSIAVTSGVILKELEALFNFDYQVDPHFDRFNDVLCGYYYRNCSTLPIDSSPQF